MLSNNKIKKGDPMGKEPMRPAMIRQMIQARYGKIAESAGSCCGAASIAACCAPQASDPENVAAQIGYSRDEVATAPEAAEMGLGCGNPQAIANLQTGETVLDLGSGAGFDCFLAARAVGPTGRVIGVDMTDAMLRKARRNADKTGIANVEFRRGEIEHLPVNDNSVDVIISNCVVNLSPEKAIVLRETFRVLKPGGRLAISDVVAVRPMPDAIRNDEAMQCACIGGAASVEDLRQMLRGAGFEKIRIRLREESRELIKTWAPGHKAEDYVISAFIEAVKPTDRATG
jgi:SAM-dependent methyltransferase